MELYRWNWYRITSVFTIPSDWDDKGNIITISIMTFDEDEYFIDKDEVGGNGCRSSWKRSRVCTHLTLLMRQGPLRAHPVVSA